MELGRQSEYGRISPIGWYVHLPFCRRKCGYCDFYSVANRLDLAPAAVAAIRDEISRFAPERPVEAVFIGGGTPTELPAEALAAILTSVADRAAGTPEWTVEGNPVSAAEATLGLLRRCGVNRISFGVQSFHQVELDRLERLHTPEDAAASVQAARRVGVDNVSLDLIYAIPGQTLQTWRASLRRAIDLDVEHLSCYALTYESGTPMASLRSRGELTPCDEELEVEMYEAAIEELGAAGFEHYEISNFARTGRRCRANVIYWENREYVGFGPSAVSYIDGVRRRNVADLDRYIAWMREDPSRVTIEEERLSEAARACETAVQMLRLREGISVAGFRERTGYDPLAFFASPIETFSAAGLLSVADGAIRLTHRGRLLANRVMAGFLLDESEMAGEASPASD